jgi:hypothetical protein
VDRSQYSLFIVWALGKDGMVQIICRPTKLADETDKRQLWKLLNSLKVKVSSNFLYECRRCVVETTSLNNLYPLIPQSFLPLWINDGV